MKTKLDLATWPRKDHFNFFSQFEEPFFGVTVNVNCTIAYQRAKELGVSFFLYYLHCSLSAANQTEAFRYRIIDNDVFIYDDVHASATINRPNGTFGFSYIDYKPQLIEFIEDAKREIDKVQAASGLVPANAGENVIHYSAMPWINFTGLTHARSFSFKDSIPKISFGMVTVTDERRMMPVSVTVHHGLMDGLHVSYFVDRFQQLLDT